MTRIAAVTGFAAIALAVITADLAAQEPRRAGDISFDGAASGIRSRTRSAGPFGDFNALTAGADKVEGLINLYRKGEHLYAELPMHQLNQPLLVPVTIARGIGRTGHPVGDEDMIIVFRRVDDRIQVVRRNIHYKASDAPLAKSVMQNYTDSVLMSLPILAINPMRGAAAIVDFSDIFFTDFAQLGLGPIDRSRTSWAKAKGFAHNMELEVEATFAGGPGALRSQNDGVADHRGITVVIHYSLIRPPGYGYRPRMADDRVGHFLSATKDFGIPDADSNFVRMINRWRLEKANPHAKLSPPRKQIIWYVEDTVPIEYRPYVEEGIREWNKAFEKIGFRDAIAVRWEEAGRDEFDPEDTNYCTFRWVTSDMGYARSCLRANPMTGEMIDGDVVFDAGFIRHWKQQYALLIASTKAADGSEQSTPLALGEVISPILAAKMGFGQPSAGSLMGMDALQRNPSRLVPEVIPADQNFLAWELAQTRRGTTGDPASSSSACSATWPWPRSPWPMATARRMPRCRRRRFRPPPAGEAAAVPEAPAQRRAARGVPRPGDQEHRDARGRALAGPATQLQGEHDAEGRPAPRHGDHAREGPDRQRDGLLPDQHRAQGQEAGRLLFDHAGPV